MAAEHRIVTLALLALAIGAGGCSAPSLVVAGRAQVLKPKGRFGATASTFSGTSSTKSLGIEDDVVVPAVGADLRLGPTNIAVDAFTSSFDGKGTAEAQIDIGGITIAPTTPVATKIDLDYGRAALTWDLLPGDTLELGLGLGAGFADFHGRITDLTANQSGSADQTLFFPVLAGRGVVKWNSLMAKVIASGIYVDYGGSDLRLIDLDLGGGWRFFAPSGTDHLAGQLQAGYRYLSIDANFDDANTRAKADLDFLGPYVGLAISF